jgi:SAM-dependent methyltransferase
VRLNIGCGHRRIEGYVGVDITQREGVDLVAPAHAVPLPDATAEEVMAIHIVEHLFAWDVPVALAEWFRLLQPGGKLVLEMPDLLKACRNVAEDRKGRKHPDQIGMWAIYGDDRLRDPLMVHRAGWWFERLKPVVESVGFDRVTEHETVFHPVGRTVRDFRLEAYKPAAASS